MYETTWFSDFIKGSNSKTFKKGSLIKLIQSRAAEGFQVLKELREKIFRTFLDGWIETAPSSPFTK